MNQSANLYEPIYASKKGTPPLVIRAVVTPGDFYTADGAVQQSQRVESYVLFSALPEELRARVATAVQALIAGM